MRDTNKTKAQLVEELEALRLRVAKLEKPEAKHKRSEEALQTERNKLAALVAAMECGLTIQDKDYNIIYQNQVLRDIFGDKLGEKCYKGYKDCPAPKSDTTS